MVQYKLTYFPVRGRVEFIRYILAQADVEYEMINVPRDQWPQLKPNTPTGKLPLLEVDGKILFQSLTIGRFLAERFNLAGSTEWNKAYADMIVHAIEGVYHHFIPFINALSDNDDKSKCCMQVPTSLIKFDLSCSKADAWQRFKETVTIPLFNTFEKMLDSKQWFCDNELTWADLYVAELCDRLDTCFDKTFLDNYPHMKQHMKRVHNLPNIRKYIDKRPPYTF